MLSNDLTDEARLAAAVSLAHNSVCSSMEGAFYAGLAAILGYYGPHAMYDKDAWSLVRARVGEYLDVWGPKAIEVLVLKLPVERLAEIEETLANLNRGPSV